MNVKEYFKQRALEIENDLISTRRHLHAHPELSFHEEKTMEFVAEKLTDLQIPFQKNIGGYGIVGIIEGKNLTKKTIALRADLDALPILERNEKPYASKNSGVMHACGHDAHTTSLLGAAQLLNEVKAHFEGSIKLIFQPAEERIPGGASLMIKDGVLENPNVETIVGQHVYPQLEVGKVGFKTGMYMASSDEIYITVHGKGGHGAMPHLSIDPILVASHIVVALQQVVSRYSNPITPSVLTIGKFIGNGATNVIPDEVKIEGTFRTFDEEWRKDAKKLIRQIVENTANAMGAKAEVSIKDGYPFLKNDENLTEKSILWAIEYLGNQNVEILPMRTSSEDFAYYTQQIPACFYRLGIANKQKGITSLLHTATFDIDESALKIGAGLMAWLAYKQLV